MKLCINQATTLPTPFGEDINAYADVGWTAVEVGLTKLEQFLKTHSIDDVRRLFTERGLTPAAASYQGGLMLSQGEERKAHFEHFRNRLELCQAIGIKTLIVVADFMERPTETDLRRAIISLAQAGQWAAGFEVQIAVEFPGKSAFCTTLDTGLSLVEECGEPNVGICLDLFHFYKGPSKEEDFAKLTKGNLSFVQLSDVAGVPREWMTDSDRVFPGDGDFQFGPIMAALQRIGYDGYVSLEVTNPIFWQMKPTQVAELGLMALCRVIE
jgi:sugar phosphate isomerase/epimerase